MLELQELESPLHAQQGFFGLSAQGGNEMLGVP